ncbi:dienelactone hydrolase [Chitinophaga polysaccharea]|uniref:Dienelactone hydrolase n=1 Tax=Chitinophaga polysaccharea TaxID=1293035 RepID=A0A561P9M5_9BACT|nr:dienelactone hydrolase family protein [Chitinophaga polysaccharea]TWF34835.1 dienelactone hydrolase [Chitinophaga polysaccharea]
MLQSFSKTVKIPAGQVMLDGELTIPAGATAIVIFSHGSGSSRFSPRNQSVALALQQHGFGTLLFDLLTKVEETGSYYTRFNISLLTSRLVNTTKWLSAFQPVNHSTIGYFGASTGAAAALEAASELPYVQAVVSRGGRPDLAATALPVITTPTLLIVGSLDPEVLALNQHALTQLKGPKKLLVIPGAGHLFEEGDTLRQVGIAAIEWFDQYLHLKST